VSPLSTNTRCPIHSDRSYMLSASVQLHANDAVTCVNALA
jgi:hypothetical protein